MIDLSSRLLLLYSFFLLLAACNDAPTEDQEKEEPIKTMVQDSLPISEPVEQPMPDTSTMDSILVDTVPKVQKIERPTRKPAKIKFEKTSYLYDTIQQGDVVEYSFKFKNIGQRPLIIKDVKGSCGCTIASYPFLDIAPNEESAIKTRFDSKGKKGAQFTTITVYSNANPKGDVLSLKGMVIE